MEKIYDEFGYDPDEEQWFPEEIEFKLRLQDVKQPDGSIAKNWIIEHNLAYYDLIFLGVDSLGIDPKMITGSMVIKACLAASWNDASVSWMTKFTELVAQGASAEEQFDDEEEQ